jgi:uncharacterized phiE125 gp8 family phage protein
MYRPQTRRKTTTYARPLDLEKLKLHLKVDGIEEDAYISDLAIAASALWEERVGQAVMEAEYVSIVSRFSSLVGGLRGPVSAIQQVRFWAETGAEVSLDASAYGLSSLRADAVLFPGWQSYRLYPAAAEPIVITYLAGAKTTDDVPPLIQQFIRLTVAHWYENRQEVIPGVNGVQQIPLGAQTLIDLEREPVL